MFTAKLRTVGTALFLFVLAMWFVFPGDSERHHWHHGRDPEHGPD